MVGAEKLYGIPAGLFGLGLNVAICVVGSLVVGPRSIRPPGPATEVRSSEAGPT